MLLSRFKKCSIEVKCQLFKSYCSNLYCSQFWYEGHKGKVKKLVVAFNNSLCRFLQLPKCNSASDMFVRCNIPSFGELHRRYVFGFMERTKICKNTLVQTCTQNLFSPRSCSKCQVHSSMCMFVVFFNFKNLFFIFTFLLILIFNF